MTTGLAQAVAAPPRAIPGAVIALAAFLVLFALAFAAPLERQQEARVLETAREMLDGGGRNWVIPRLNGRVRLHKPPLTYWLAAGSFALFGVQTWSGRLPMVIGAWLTLVLTWRIAARLFGPRAALLSAGMLAGSLLFLQNAKLAETDGTSMLLVTAACWMLWRGAEEGKLWCFAGSAVAMGLELIDKGPPAAYAALFLVCLSLVLPRMRRSSRRGLAPVVAGGSEDRSLTVAAQTEPQAAGPCAAVGTWAAWLRSGAPLILLAIALPWWIMALRDPAAATIANELSDLSTGRDHYGWPWEPILFAIKATLPWTGFVVLGIVAAAGHGRRDHRLHVLLLWAGSILLPLMLIPQKQEHYLMPMLPPLMLLAGWAADRAIGGEDKPLKRAATLTLGVTTMLGAAAGPALFLAGGYIRHRIHPADAIACALIPLMMLPLFVLYRRRGLATALPAAVFSGAGLVLVAVALWGPSLRPMTYQKLARQIETRCGGGPYVFYGVENYRLCFEMRRVVPLCRKADDLAAALRSTPQAIVICEEERDAPPVPGWLAEVAEFRFGDKSFRVYRAR